jgi:hypothetical protein
MILGGKSPILEERSEFHGEKWSQGEQWSMYIQHCIRVVSLVQKGRDYSEEDQIHLDMGRNPKESSSRGSIPKGRMTLCH